MGPRVGKKLPLYLGVNSHLCVHGSGRRARRDLRIHYHYTGLIKNKLFLKKREITFKSVRVCARRDQ